MRLLPLSQTKTFPLASTATPRGKLNCPFPEPSVPQVIRNVPPLSNSLTRTVVEVSDKHVPAPVHGHPVVSVRRTTPPGRYGYCRGIERGSGSARSGCGQPLRLPTARRELRDPSHRVRRHPTDDVAQVREGGECTAGRNRRALRNIRARLVFPVTLRRSGV